MVFAFLGTTEIIIILVIALLVFGPQKLPEIGRLIGGTLREMNKMRSDVQRVFDIEDLTRDTQRYGGYGSTSHASYDSNPYGAATYPATTTFDSSHTLESAASDTGSVQELAPHVDPHTSAAESSSPATLDYEPLKTPHIAEPSPLPYTVSVSAGSAVAHVLDNTDNVTNITDTHAGSHGASTSTATAAASHANAAPVEAAVTDAVAVQPHVSDAAIKE